MNRPFDNVLLVVIVAGLASFAFQAPAECGLITGLGGSGNVAPLASSNVAAGATDQTISDRTGYIDAPYTVFVTDGGNVTLTWATPQDLMNLGAYISSNKPAGVNTYLDRETGSIDFELNMGVVLSVSPPCRTTLSSSLRKIRQISGRMLRSAETGAMLPKLGIRSIWSATPARESVT